MYISIINIEKFNYSNDNIFGLFLYMLEFINIVLLLYWILACILMLLI